MPVKRGSLCTNCGTDYVLNKKLSKLSDSLYNKGLAEAKAGCLSRAVESLSKSVTYNKRNIVAQNLLGVVLFECGRVTEALKHWIISSSLLKRNNAAQAYIDRVQQNTDTFERYAQAIEHYNNALSYLKQRNEDMALIQVKKAIDLNPFFIDALNLMSLCFLVSKDKEQAAVSVERVLALDVNNPIALNYYKILNPAKGRQEPYRRENRPSQSAKPEPVVTASPFLYAKAKPKFSMFHLASVLLFFVGVICTFAYFSVVVIPPMVEGIQNENTALKADVEKLTGDNQTLQDNLDSASSDYSSEIDNLKAENADLKAGMLVEQNVQNVNTASIRMNSGDLEAAAELLYTVDEDLLPSGTRGVREMYDSMVLTEVYPPVASDLYGRGVAQYNLNEYTEAKRLFEKANQFSAAGSSTKPGIIYYLGLTAQALGENEAAIAYFSDIVENYPDFTNVNNASNLLAELTQG
jgi:tetratricopeptide (TPR) repeat protein